MVGRRPVCVMNLIPISTSLAEAGGFFEISIIHVYIYMEDLVPCILYVFLTLNMLFRITSHWQKQKKSIYL